MTNEERDKAIRILQWLHDNKFLFSSTEEDVKFATKLAIQELQQEPSISEQEPKTGHWITHCYQNCKCSRCGYVISEYDSEEFKFCPNCGEKMAESEGIRCK